MSDGPTLSVTPNPNIACRVVLDDGDVLALAKEAGVVTQPGEGHERDTLLSFAFSLHGKRLQNLGRGRDFGLVHRLDRPTSGLVLLGLTPEAYDGLRTQFAERLIQKTYVALIHAGLKPPEGEIDAPIREVRAGGLKRAAVGPGRGAQTAITRYLTLARGAQFSLMECAPKTGRLHQLRAHFASLGCPILGDSEYGERSELDRAFKQVAGKAIGLHAGGLRFVHPIGGQTVTLRAPLPSPLKAFLEQSGVPCPRAWR